MKDGTASVGWDAHREFLQMAMPPSGETRYVE